MGEKRQYANDFDQSTTVAMMLGRPTYADILNLPDHTEACVVWEDGQADAYDIDQAFKDHMRQEIDAHPDTSVDDHSGVHVMFYVTPDKMHPKIAEALQRRERNED